MCGTANCKKVAGEANRLPARGCEKCRVRIVVELLKAWWSRPSASLYPDGNISESPDSLRRSSRRRNCLSILLRPHERLYEQCFGDCHEIQVGISGLQTQSARRPTSRHVGTSTPICGGKYSVGSPRKRARQDISRLFSVQRPSFFNTESNAEKLRTRNHTH